MSPVWHLESGLTLRSSRSVGVARLPWSAMGSGRSDDRHRFVRGASVASLVASVPFLLVLWDVGLRPLRTALPDGTFADFYDIQARAMMRGHLDVPSGSLAFEAFRLDGRDYLYFPPWPSILRMPVMAVTDALDGRLTALSMAVAWIVIMVLTSMLIWRVRGLLRPGVALGRLELATDCVLIAAVGGGSAIVYVASLPWVYHEAFMWAIAMSLGAAWATVGVLIEPSRRRIVVAGVWALGAVLTRVTVGWTWCLTLVAVGVAFAGLTRWRHPRRVAGAVIAAGIVPLSIGIVVNWIKFRHPFLIPLDQQLVAGFSVNRREALAANGGGMTGPQFLPSTAFAYLRPDGIRFTAVFPFVTLPARPPPVIGGTVFDEVYRTGSITTFMPLLVGLSIAGLAATFRTGASHAAAMLRLPVIGAAAGTGGVLLFGYIAHRYTSEFLPGLVVLSVIGLVDLQRRADGWNRRGRRGLLAVVTVLAGFGVVANTATGVAASRSVWRGDRLVAFLDARHTVSDITGHPNDGYVERVPSLSGEAAAEHLRVVGACDAVYLATGNDYEPWIVVDVRPVDIRIDTAATTAPAGLRRLASFEGATRWMLAVEFDGAGRRRLRVDGGGEPQLGEWGEASNDGTVSVRGDSDRSRYGIHGPGLVAAVPFYAWDAEWVSRPVQLDTSGALRTDGDADVVTVVSGDPSAFCTRLVAELE